MAVSNLDAKEYKRRLLERAAGLKRFAEWETEHPVEMSPAQALAAIGALYDLIPLQARKRDFDSKLKGIIAMRTALAVLKGSR
ncbi:MAG: hypothetical protein E3J71_04590 [Candidatus Stahlbacteria bacterium]|nr:MAG: hypothetical protein E3J71_04590 [Candidatus Stahlbacteria bacterium]